MARLRVALVTRRYWPLLGGAEQVMGTLAEAMQQLQVEPTIITAQWEAHWPLEITQLTVPVVRLPHPNVRGWGTLRYLWALNRWLRRHRHAFDAVIVSSLKEDAYAALATLSGSEVPVVLRAEKGGPHGDCHWQATAPFGTRIRQRCRAANAIIAPNHAIAEELIEAGYAAESIEQIANGVPLLPARTEERRLAARASLGEIQHDLKVDAATPIALYIGSLAAGKGLHDLVRAWRKIGEIWPTSRLWIVGEGPERSDLYERIRDCHLQYQIVMPGAFDDVTEFLSAADLFISPEHVAGSSLALLEAMSAGLPVVASKIPSHAQFLTDQVQGLLVPVKNSAALAEAIANVLTLREAATQRAEQARKLVLESYSATRMAEQHITLIERLFAQKQP